jgi:hypothetical protein
LRMLSRSDPQAIDNLRDAVGRGIMRPWSVTIRACEDHVLARCEPSAPAVDS